MTKFDQLDRSTAIWICFLVITLACGSLLISMRRNSVNASGLPFAEPRTAFDRGFVEGDWSLTPLEGVEPIRFSEFQGRPVLVNIWATWCSPCVAEMPTLQQLFERDDLPEDVSMLLVTDPSGNPSGQAQQLLDQLGVTIPAYQVQNYPDALASATIPATFLLDRQGNVRYFEDSAFDWNSDDVVKLLDELAAETYVPLEKGRETDLADSETDLVDDDESDLEVPNRETTNDLADDDS